MHKEERESITKVCLYCKKDYCRKEGECYRDFNLRKYCSFECRVKCPIYKQNNIDSHNTPEYVEALKKRLLGRIFTTEHCKKISNSLKNTTKRDSFFKPGEDNIAFGRNQTGPNNHNWKGGITNNNQKFRNSPEYEPWRIFCMQRDKYTCQICGDKAQYVQVHHIKELHEFPELAWDKDNGITVCVPCHEKIHGKFIGTKQKKY
jgi:5-methylcytosine-specific restriction protein A